AVATDQPCCYYDRYDACWKQVLPPDRATHGPPWIDEHQAGRPKKLEEVERDGPACNQAALHSAQGERLPGSSNKPALHPCREKAASEAGCKAIDQTKNIGTPGQLPALPANNNPQSRRQGRRDALAQNSDYHTHHED